MRVSTFITITFMTMHLDAATLVGTVTEILSGSAIPGVSVTVTAPNTTAISARSDANGSYSISVPAEVPLHVEYSLKGYQGYPTPHDRTVHGRSLMLNVRLVREQQDDASLRKIAEMIRLAASAKVGTEIREAIRHLASRDRDFIDALLSATPPEQPKSKSSSVPAQTAAADRIRVDSASQSMTTLRSSALSSFHAATAQRESDTKARIAAENAFDETGTAYLAALQSTDERVVDSTRSARSNRRSALETIRERERLDEQTIQTTVENLRHLAEVAQEGVVPDELIMDLQFDVTRAGAELNLLRRERESALERRETIERIQQFEIARAERAHPSLTPERREEEKFASDPERDAKTLRMEAELARIAQTRSDRRAFIVSLPGGLLFDTGRNTLSRGAEGTLTRIAEQLKINGKAKVMVEAHTDNVGSAEKNQQLSEMRAKAVLDFLVSMGVAPERITAMGRGEEEPIATNKTAAGRQQNRRVDLVIH